MEITGNNGGLYKVKGEQTAISVTPPVPVVPKTPATPEELKKAAKTVALQSQYVPGMPAGHPEAEKLLAAFNTKYEGKMMASPEQLEQKVHDFKTLTAQMVPFQSEVQKAQAALQSASATEKAAAQAKLKAAEAEKKAAEKAAFEAKLTDPKVKAQYDALHSIGEHSGAHLDEQHAGYIKKLAAQGSTINGADAAYIVAYRGHHYDALNENLWKQDQINLQQAVYAGELTKALNKLPSYSGYAQRGVKSPANAFARYAANVGKVVTEHGFSSYGETHKLWGKAATIHLQSKDLRDMRVFNSEGGGELILPRGSLLHITKVDPKTKEVWAEQVG